MSTYSTPSSLIVLRKSDALICRSSTWIFQGVFLKCVRAGFTGANADGLFDMADENLAVADLVGLGGLDDGLDGGVNLVIVQNHINLNFGQEIDNVFSAAIQLGMAFLAAKSLDLNHAEALDAGVLQG